MGFISALCTDLGKDRSCYSYNVGLVSSAGALCVAPMSSVIPYGRICVSNGVFVPTAGDLPIAYAVKCGVRVLEDVNLQCGIGFSCWRNVLFKGSACSNNTHGAELLPWKTICNSIVCGVGVSWKYVAWHTKPKPTWSDSN